jgi:hypothetical protein
VAIECLISVGFGQILAELMLVLMQQQLILDTSLFFKQNVTKWMQFEGCKSNK